MGKYNEVTQCVSFSPCQYLELCVLSNEALLRKGNVKYYSKPVNVAGCIMKKKNGSSSEICWWSLTAEL
jgi:hypothetical protein